MGAACSSGTGEDPNNNVKKQQPVAKGTGTTSEKSERHTLPELKQEPEIEDVHVPKTVAGYPPVKVPIDKKDDIFVASKMWKVDERARQVPEDKATSYQDLIAHLTAQCVTDVEKVRSIFVWMSNQSIESADYSNVTDADTPRGFMKLIRDHRASYSSFFAVLCRHAGIPCVVIEGYAKSAGYTVGDTEENIKTLRNSWNAVHVDGGWRLVFPLWACQAVIGHSLGTYTKVETKGKAVREKEQESSGTTIKHFNEYYFLTDPDNFIFVVWAKDPRWQLLKRPWSLQKFVDVPYCRNYFFLEKLNIQSKFSCRLKTKEGMCTVDVTCEKPHGMSMDYELYYNHKESGKELSSSLQLNNYVMLERSESTWRFVIRFPEIGVYKLQIVGGHGFETDLCAFRIDCQEVTEDCKPYPFNPGKVGYGPNNDTVIAGINAISHKVGLVKVVARREVCFNFQLTRDVIVKTELRHSTISKDELADCVKQTQTNRNVSVQVSIPENGEYALTLHTKHKNEQEYKNVCNYLLTSEEGRKKRIRTWENPVEKNTRNKVQEMTKSKSFRDIDDFEKKLHKFEKLQLDDKGDLTAGRDALELKKIRRELDDAIKRRHLETLERAITHGKESRFRDKVAKQITEAEDVRDHLKHLNKIAHDVLEMKQTTIAELRSYKYPPDVIVDVMRSTFLMLGEKKEEVEDWEDLQMLMGKLGKDSMLRRVRNFDTVRVQPDTKYYVDRTQQEHTETEVRLASAGAGTFYVWLRDVSKAMNEETNTIDRQR